jgi:hypothetical protein
MPMNKEIVHCANHHEKTEQPKRNPMHFALADIRADFHAEPA